MNTMRIATPVGYSSRPPRKVWPVVLGLALVLGVGGGVLSVTCFGRDNAARSGEAEAHVADGSAAGEPGVATAGSAAPAGSDGDAAAVVMPPRPPPRAPTFSDPPSEPPEANTHAGSGSAGRPAAVAGDPPPAASPVPVPVQPAAPVHTAHLTIESVPTGAAVKGPRGAALGRTPVVLEWPTSDVPVTFELRLAGYRAKQKQTVVNGNTRLVIELERAPVRHPGGASKPSSGGNGLMRPDE